MFSYGWANDLVYRVFGENPPGGAAPAAARVEEPAAASSISYNADTTNSFLLSLDELFDRASTQLPDWQTITLTLPDVDSATAQFRIDQGNGGQPQKRHDVTLDMYTGQVTLLQPFDSQSPGRQARLWIRFLHTGEALGIVGQTVAGLVSLTSLVMVWTGFALAWRRLVTPLFRRRRPEPAPRTVVAETANS